MKKYPERKYPESQTFKFQLPNMGNKKLNYEYLTFSFSLWLCVRLICAYLTGKLPVVLLPTSGAHPSSLALHVKDKLPPFVFNFPASQAEWDADRFSATVHRVVGIIPANHAVLDLERRLELSDSLVFRSQGVLYLNQPNLGVGQDTNEIGKLGGQNWGHTLICDYLTVMVNTIHTNQGVIII